jgi:hypothetical protein
MSAAGWPNFGDYGEDIAPGKMHNWDTPDLVREVLSGKGLRCLRQRHERSGPTSSADTARVLG